MLTALLVLLGSSSAWAASPALALGEVPVDVTGSVVDAGSGVGVAGADVDASGPSSAYASTAEDGSYSMSLTPGSYEVYVWAEGYESGYLQVEVTQETTTLPVIELDQLVRVDVTGSVVDAGSGVGVAGADVDASGPSSVYASTAEDGSYSMSLTPGSYQLNVWADGYESGSLDVEVTEETTSLPPVEVQALTPGIHVEVYDSTFGGPAENAVVSLTGSAGGSGTTLTADADGRVVFAEPAVGDYTVRVEQAADYLASEPVDVTYDGGVEQVYLDARVDLSCTPEAANTGLTNMGFENDLAGWKLGHQTEVIQAVGADGFAAPWEGAKMARLGTPQPSADESQKQGPNILCQDFVVTDAEETFAFNAFTYDYTGYDQFDFDVVVTEPDTGDTLASYRQGAWGEGTAMKTSGWRGVRLDLSGHVGETVRLTFRAGGTRDQLFAFWTYLDSAENLPPVIETSVADIRTETGSATTDPVTGQVTVAMPAGSPSDLTMVVPAQCAADAATPSSVQLLLNGTGYSASPTDGGKYTVTIPQESIESGSLMLEVQCEGETTLVVPIGQIVLYDPSGVVSNALTGDPVVGAEVTLYKVPGWTPQGAEGPYPDESCQTNLSKPVEEPWSQPAPTAIGQEVSAASPEISPNTNPFVTNKSGYYGWDVAEGCWYVSVEADGYQSLTSPVVGVPTEVTDLDLALEPLPVSNTERPQVSGKAKVGSTLTASAGAWNMEGLGFAYQWLRNGKQISGATAATYKVAPADANTSLSVKVTGSKAQHPDGTAISVAVRIPKIASSVRLIVPKTVKKGKAVKTTAEVKAVAGRTPTGKVVVKRGKKIVGSASLRSGKATIMLAKFKKPGKYKVVATYNGTTKIARSTSKAMTIRVVRR